MSKVDPNNVLAEMCGTCPWRAGSPYANLRPDLEKSALTNGNRVCHSTGSNGIHWRTGKPERICRGARNAQLSHFHAIGFLPAPTDEAWAEKLTDIRRAKQPSRPLKKIRKVA